MAWASSNLSIATGPRRKRRHRIASTAAALLLLSLASLGLAAQSTDPGATSLMAHVASTTAAANSTLPKITIEAAKEKELRLKVDQFVLSVVDQPLEGSLLRWNTPVCPLVAGLPKSVGEFVLERISNAARDARAPLAGRVCHPNLYVVATDHPDLLLRKWWARDRNMYSTGSHGLPPIRRFINSGLPVRIWYNTIHGCGGGLDANAAASAAAMGGVGPPGIGPPICWNDLADGSHFLVHEVLRSITSAIVVVDLRQMRKATIRQLADYIALVSLIDVRLDADPGAAPSILRLFAGHAKPPQGLSSWDRALLYSLYNTNQKDRLQVPEMELTMVRRIVRISHTIAPPFGSSTEPACGRLARQGNPAHGINSLCAERPARSRR